MDKLRAMMIIREQYGFKMLAPLWENDSMNNKDARNRLLELMQDAAKSLIDDSIQFEVSPFGENFEVILRTVKEECGASE